MKHNPKRYEIYGTIVWLKNCKLRRCSSLSQVSAELKVLQRNTNYSDLRVVKVQ